MARLSTQILTSTARIERQRIIESFLHTYRERIRLTRTLRYEDNMPAVLAGIARASVNRLYVHVPVAASMPV